MRGELDNNGRNQNQFRARLYRGNETIYKENRNEFSVF